MTNPSTSYWNCSLTLATRLSFLSYSPTNLLEFLRFAPQYFTRLDRLRDNSVTGTTLFGIDKSLLGVDGVNFDFLVTIRLIYPNCSSLSSSNSSNHRVTPESGVWTRVRDPLAFSAWQDLRGSLANTAFKVE